jgi:hypothetical protein
MEDLKSALNKLENAISVAEGVQLPTEEDHYVSISRYMLYLEQNRHACQRN